MLKSPGAVVDASGSIFGDPDSDTLSFTCGTANGLASSGSSTLQRDGGPGSDFHVDSYFDIDHEISFTGAPGSLLDGMGGTHSDSTRLAVCNNQSPPVSTRPAPPPAVIPGATPPGSRPPFRQTDASALLIV